MDDETELECNICYDPFSCGPDYYRFEECGDTFCKDCISETFRVRIEEE